MARQALPRADIRFEQSLVDHYWANTMQLGDDLRGVQSSLQLTRCNVVKSAKSFGRKARLVDAGLSQFNIGVPLPALLHIPLRLAMANDQQFGDDIVCRHKDAG